MLSATAVDAAGRLGRDRVVVWRDTQAPRCRLTAPSNGTIVGPDGDGNATVRVAGVVDLDSEPHLGEVSVTTAAGTVPARRRPAHRRLPPPSCRSTPACAGQPQPVTVTALDTLGHEGVVTVFVTFDPPYPAIVLAAPADLVLLDGSPPTRSPSPARPGPPRAPRSASTAPPSTRPA